MKREGKINTFRTTGNEREEHTEQGVIEILAEITREQVAGWLRGSEWLRVCNVCVCVCACTVAIKGKACVKQTVFQTHTEFRVSLASVSVLKTLFRPIQQNQGL